MLVREPIMASDLCDAYDAIDRMGAGARTCLRATCGPGGVIHRHLGYLSQLPHMSLTATAASNFSRYHTWRRRSQ